MPRVWEEGAGGGYGEVAGQGGSASVGARCIHFRGPAVAAETKQDSSQLVEQRLRPFEVRRIEAFGEPAIDRREQIAGFERGQIPSLGR